MNECIPTIEHWLNGFYTAEYIVTDSFHGCVFSIIFNKPFIVYANTDRGYSRFESLLNLFNIKDRMIHSINELTRTKIEQNIDWESINSILKTNKDLSMQFLKTNLNS